MSRTESNGLTRHPPTSACSLHIWVDKVSPSNRKKVGSRCSQLVYALLSSYYPIRCTSSDYCLVSLTLTVRNYTGTFSLYLLLGELGSLVCTLQRFVEYWGNAVRTTWSDEPGYMLLCYSILRRLYLNRSWRDFTLDSCRIRAACRKWCTVRANCTASPSYQALELCRAAVKILS